MAKKKLPKKQNSIRTISCIINHLHASVWRLAFGAFGKYFVLRSSLNLTFKPHAFNSKGFTLTELVTAIGVFTILSTIAITVLDPIEQFKKAQDGRRKSDLAQVQRALESYYQDYGRYPAYTGCCGAFSFDEEEEYTINVGNGEGAEEDVVNWGESWAPYIDLLPVDPNSSKRYIYWSNPSNGFQSYAIYASLDRGDRDPSTCNSSGFSCSGVPEEAPGNPIACGENGENCNFGVTSPNISP